VNIIVTYDQRLENHLRRYNGEPCITLDDEEFIFIFNKTV